MINTKVAAVIVTFNRKKLLIECLHAILQQSVPVDKIFVINNASTDGTEKLFEAGGEFDAKKIICVNMDSNTGGGGGVFRLRKWIGFGLWMMTLFQHLTAWNSC